MVPTKCHAVVPYCKRLNRWLINKHWARWRCLGGTKRQAGELISGPGWDAKAKLMSINRTQSRTVIGLLTGHNTLRRHLHRQPCTIFFVNVRLWPLSDMCIWAPFLELEDI